jgi:hypothetical protein
MDLNKECKFRAQFGPRRGDKKILLKTFNLYHNGFDQNGVYDNGKKFKQQLTSKMGDTVEMIKNVKHSKPVAKDVVKAAKTLQGEKPTYNQGHQIISKRKNLDKFESKKSYELLIPYLEEFKKKNPGSIAVYEVDNNSLISKIFLCPRIMNYKLRFVPFLHWMQLILAWTIKGRCI